MRQWIYRNPSQSENELVEAEWISFEPAHVCWWKKDDAGRPPVLVMGVRNEDALWIVELIEDETT